MFENAVKRKTPKSTNIKVKVKPGTKESVFPFKYDQWRNHFVAKTKAEPREGKANKELINLIQKFFGLGNSEVKLVRGRKTREKTIGLSLNFEEVEEGLKNGLEK